MQPTLFLYHDGGPCFFLEPGPMRQNSGEPQTCLCGFMSTFSEMPHAILAISSHWEEDVPSVYAGVYPPLLFDYGGFPDYAYKLTWPVPGSPDLAVRVRELLSDAGIANNSEPARSRDHGVRAPQGNGA